MARYAYFNAATTREIISPYRFWEKSAARLLSWGPYYSPRDVLGVCSLLTGPQLIGCAARCPAASQGTACPLSQVVHYLSWGPVLWQGKCLEENRVGFRSPAYRICCLYGWGFWAFSPSQNNPAAHVLSWGPKFSLQNSLEVSPSQTGSPA